jgi:hypothetical protein
MDIKIRIHLAVRSLKDILLAVLRIRDVIPYPGSKRQRTPGQKCTGSRVRIRNTEMKILSVMFIPDPDFSIPVLGSRGRKKARDPGSKSPTLLFSLMSARPASI